MSAQQDDDDKRIPLLDHLLELRSRLIKSLIALGVAFAFCFLFADDIFALLLIPFEQAAQNNSPVQLIYTAPQEYFFTQLKLSLFGAFLLAFPYISAQVYLFVAPGLYKNERKAFLPFLVASPVLFALGALFVHSLIMPLALRFFLSMEITPDSPEHAAVSMLPRVSEYLSLTTTLIVAFGLSFQLPILLTLLVRARVLSAQTLKNGRKYAVVLAFLAAAVLTPPDLISQIGLAVPIILLYEISIFIALRIEERRALQDDDIDDDDDDDDFHNET